MTKYNPKENVLGVAMGITDPQDAEQYLKAYIADIQKALDKKPDPSGKTAEQIAKNNLGYFSGYCDEKTRARVEKLFMCSHPIFGSIEENGTPTSEEAFQTGFKRKTLKEVHNEKNS
jgi:hypothetical protein